MPLGPLIILSGPSGTGKSTVIRRLLDERRWPLHLSVSATTRARRPNEEDGVHYHFWSAERFREEVGRGGFLEWAEVYGNYYGTLREEVFPRRQRGEGVILDIDTKGFDQVRRQCPDAVSVFLRTSSLEEYARRLERRGTESGESMARRLKSAAAELARAPEYDHQVINDDLDTAVATFRALVAPLFERTTDAG